MITNLLSRAWVYPLLFCSFLSCSGIAQAQAQRDLDPQARPQIPQSTVISKGARRLAPGEFGWTELMDAAAQGDLARVQDVLAKGADVNARDHSGRTALMSAANAAVAQALIAKGADVNAKAQNGMSALAYALLGSQIDVAQILLDKGADPNAKDTRGSHVLREAALRGHATIVRALLEKGADPNAKDDSGMTALLYAVERHSSAVVQALLDRGADPNAKDRYGQTPLLLAAERGDEAGVRALLRKGADTNAVSGHTSMGGTHADTALKRAAAKGSASVVRALLDHGADIDGKGSSGYTALMIAAEAGQEAVVRLLLEKGAGIDARNKDGRSAFSIAEGAGQAAVVRILLAKAAAETDKEKRKGAALLLYFQAKGKECSLKTWNPTNQLSEVLLNFSRCPDEAFFVEEANALIVTTGNMIQEILVKPVATRTTMQDMLLKPAADLKTSIQLPSMNSVVLAGYLPDGRLAAVFQVIGPADDSDLSLFAFENKKWNLVTNKNCGRFFTFAGCLENRVRGRSWDDWGEDTQVWHPKLALNPFVVSRGVAMRNGGQFILDKRKASDDEETWGYVRFSVNNHQSVLLHASRLEQGDYDEAMYTFSMYLQTYKARSPVVIAEGQLDNTAIEHKYLLFSIHRNVRLVDLETGEEPVVGLKFAFWVR